MKRIVSILLFLCTFTAWSALYAQDNALTEQELREGWKLLWDGRTTNGWRGVRLDCFPDRAWTIEDGILKVHAHDGAEKVNGGDIVTTGSYGNFILKVDFKLAYGTNSGIKYLLVPDPESEMCNIGCEYQILDDPHHPNAVEGINGNRSLGALYDLIPPREDKPVDPDGWNTATVIVDGSHVEHWLNGMKLLEYERNTAMWNALVAYSKYRNREGFGSRADGLILLQDEGTEVWFKNIKIKEL